MADHVGQVVSDAQVNTRRTAESMRVACLEFLEALSPYQRSRTVFEFGDAERLVWHYTPVERQGLPLLAMDPQQRERAFALMSTGLAERGLAQARAVIDHEAVLGQLEREDWTMRFAREPGLYFFRVFGDPSGDSVWSWSVNGHHLFLTFTVVDGKVASPTPSFFGANPAEVLRGSRRGLRILADREDLARQLARTLDHQQRARALINESAPHDILTTNSQRVSLDKPEGLAAYEMTSSQQDLLVRLLGEYIHTTEAEVAQRALERLKTRGIGAVHFAWAGGVAPRQPHYYRLHGSGILVEYDNVQNGANHIHSVWRDTEGDFGMDMLAQHYQEHHRG